MSEIKLGGWLKSINQTKECLLNDDTKGDYNSYVINHALSNFLDTLFFAEEIDRLPDLDVQLQYEYYLHSVRKGKRFSAWHKPKKDFYIDIICRYYECNIQIAKDYRSILSDEQLDNMIEYLDYKGGSK